MLAHRHPLSIRFPPATPPAVIQRISPILFSAVLLTLSGCEQPPKLPTRGSASNSDTLADPLDNPAPKVPALPSKPLRPTSDAPRAGAGLVLDLTASDCDTNLPPSTASSIDRAQAHLKLAECLGREESYESASRHYQAVITLAPDTAEADAARIGLDRTTKQAPQ